MPTIFSHAVASLAIGSVHPAKERPWKFWLLGMLCSIIPDADVIGFRLIAYDSFWGHRGFTHSLSFALVFGLIITLIFYRKTPLLSKQPLFCDMHSFARHIRCLHDRRYGRRIFCAD